MAYENIRLETEDAIAILTIDRPKALNALNSKTLQELESALDSLPTTAARAHRHRRRREGLRRRRGHRRDGVASPRRRRASSPPLGHRTLRHARAAAHPDHRRGERLRARRRLRAGPRLRSHLRLGEGEARPARGEPRASSPASAARSGSPALVGKMRAKELIFTGERLDAAKAKEIGLVLDVLPADKLLAALQGGGGEDPQERPAGDLPGQAGHRVRRGPGSPGGQRAGAPGLRGALRLRGPEGGHEGLPGEASGGLHRQVGRGRRGPASACPLMGAATDACPPLLQSLFPGPPPRTMYLCALTPPGVP